MEYKVANSTEGNGCFRLSIAEERQPTDIWGSNIVEPHPEATDALEIKDSTIAGSSSGDRRATNAPEKKLTLFALRLAFLEKIANGLGKLGFVWATVVLLGGFATTLDKSDFQFITIILLIEGTRIFSMSRELEWQHQATWSITDTGMNSFRKLKSSSKSLVRKLSSTSTTKLQIHKERELTDSAHAKRSITKSNPEAPTRTWTPLDVPILPYVHWVYLTRNISKLLYWLQLFSASACVTLSLIKLINHNFGDVSEEEIDKRNRKEALNVFYALALSEAAVFLVEKAYWEWKVIVHKLLEEVNEECQFGPPGMVSIERFFYDAYSRSLSGSIFDGLEMDLVSFGMVLLVSSSSDEQLIGSRILQKFATNELYFNDTLQKIGTSIVVMERLVEMLNWKDVQQEEIRHSAAEILAKLSAEEQNSHRVARIPGVMESISSLLYTDPDCSHATDDICQKVIICDQGNHEFSVFNQMGLLILKKLACDNNNCGKIGKTRGLLSKIINFTQAGEWFLRNDHVLESQILAVKRSLQVIRMLAGTIGTTGKLIRKEISEIVFTITNIRDILKYGEKYPSLQKLGIQIITSLALEENATETIGSTGGLLKGLFIIFFNKGMPETYTRVKTAAGEALAMLAFESEKNCHRILKLNMLTKLASALEDSFLCVNAARILRNLFIYSGNNWVTEMKVVTASAPTVLQAIMSEENKLQEVMLGLAAKIFKVMNTQESTIVFEKAGIEETELAMKLVQILQQYPNPPINVPRIRRFAIELAIWMMRSKKDNIHYFKYLGMKKELECVLETTSQMESFNMFSGSIGLNRYSTSVQLLVETALGLLADE